MLNMSKQERLSWVSLLAESFIVFYYLHAVSGFKDMDHIADDFGWLVVKIIGLSILLSVIGSILMAILTGGRGDKTAHDERDRLFFARACRNAYFALCALLAIALWQLLTRQGSAWLPSGGMDTPAIALAAHFMMLSLILSGLVKYASQIFYYRRGY